MKLELDLRRTAVLPVDLQNDIVAASENVEPALQNASSVLQAARSSGVPIVHVTVSFSDGYRDAPVATHPLYKMVSENRLVLASEEGGKIHASVAPKQDELVLNKTGVDPFLTTRLAQHLRILDVNTLLLMGVWTNFAVEATARTAADLGYRVIVVRDACASNSDENHKFSMTNLMPMFASVIVAEEACQALRV